MRRRLPPLEQIEAFIEAARAPSFRIAAETCALSPAAFSRRVQALSAFIGLPLFERRGAVLALTDTGRRCLEELEPAYLELRRAAAAVSREDGERSEVTLSSSHSLAVGWVIPRLERFGHAHPEIDLALRTQREASDIRRGDADLGLCFSDVDLAGLNSRPLLPVDGTPVAAPAVAAEFKRGGETLARQRLLSVSSPPDIWGWWANTTGCADDIRVAATYDILQATYESASEGFGIAMGASPTVWPYLASGRLVTLGLPVAEMPGGAYHLAARPERRRKHAVAAVWRWLEAEAGVSPRLAGHGDAAGAQPFG